MSRIGLKPITVPNGVTVSVDAGNLVSVKGPKGELKQQIARELTIKQEGTEVSLERPNNQHRMRGQHGLARTLINNMIVGVTQGHSKTLEVHGVGFRAAVEGKTLVLNMGFSHQVRMTEVPGVNVNVDPGDKTKALSITVSGIDKAAVGQVAADIRRVRRPDPYKGKGIRYVGERIVLKAGKRAAAKK